ncbi:MULTISPECIES: glycogen synthase GlgA [Pelosinus]|uniref:Glycogen synthase n=1 Tax=Pelosinus fermentans B4 TaxID=1149862 RepID=I9L646_9FIRM|nr:MULTISPECIES: glycogen synthase GlgA [Pelosinus]EIW15809.1 glycogen/starch synthase, ADP-glucose type [Pelosinus fermentans B4]EIW27485.1 Glycogen synthase [Pelosinus fermentans A11]
MIKVLIAAAEAVPFAKTGGLGDVIGSLPKELIKQGVDARVIMPNYQDIPEGFKSQMVFKNHFFVQVGWRQQYCGILEFVYEGVTFYFADNEYYFKRHGFYGYGDDAERFGFFCRAVLEALDKIDFMPDIIHCHDWHTGMISVLLDAHYREKPKYKKIKTLFTIHNLKYQGVFSQDILHDILSLDWKYFTPEGVEFHKAVNFMKGGLAYADMISTVSRTYAKEIQDPYFGEELDGFLRKRQNRLVGIVNGIDYAVYNPATDKLISATYDVDTIENKKKNKMELQARLGLPVREDVPVIAIVSRLVSAKGLDLVERMFQDVVKQAAIAGKDTYDIQLVVLGTGEARYENFFKYMAWQYPGKVSANIMFDEDLAHQIYAGADMFLMPSLYEPCGIGQLIAMRYGCLPIVREIGGLRDTVRSYNQEICEGNGFTFVNYNAHEMADTINWALKTFQDKECWNKIVKNAMLSDYSWQKSAKEYKETYQKLIKQA